MPARAATAYADPHDRFHAQLADGWTAIPPESGVEAAFTVDGGAALFTVERADVPDGTSNIAYAKAYADAIEAKNLQDYKENDRYFLKCFTSDQCPVLDYTATDTDGKTQRLAHVFFTGGTDAWVLTYRALAENWNTYLDDVNVMLGSFTL